MAAPTGTAVSRTQAEAALAVVSAALVALGYTKGPPIWKPDVFDLDRQIVREMACGKCRRRKLVPTAFHRAPRSYKLVTVCSECADTVGNINQVLAQTLVQNAVAQVQAQQAAQLAVQQAQQAFISQSIAQNAALQQQINQIQQNNQQILQQIKTTNAQTVTQINIGNTKVPNVIGTVFQVLGVGIVVGIIVNFVEGTEDPGLNKYIEEQNKIY